MNQTNRLILESQKILLEKSKCVASMMSEKEAKLDIEINELIMRIDCELDKK